MTGAGIRYRKLGELMKSARLRAGLTAEEAAMMLGLSSPNCLYNAEAGDTNFPARKLKRAVQVYSISRRAIIEAIVDDDVAGLSKFLGGK